MSHTFFEREFLRNYSVYKAQIYVVIVIIAILSVFKNVILLACIESKIR